MPFLSATIALSVIIHYPDSSRSRGQGRLQPSGHLPVIQIVVMTDELGQGGRIAHVEFARAAKHGASDVIDAEFQHAFGGDAGFHPQHVPGGDASVLA